MISDRDAAMIELRRKGWDSRRIALAFNLPQDDVTAALKHVEHLQYFAQLGMERELAPLKLQFEDDE